MECCMVRSITVLVTVFIWSAVWFIKKLTAAGEPRRDRDTAAALARSTWLRHAIASSCHSVILPYCHHVILSSSHLTASPHRPIASLPHHFITHVIRHIMVAADGVSDPEGVVVRPVKGLSGCDYLGTGTLNEATTWVFGPVIDYLQVTAPSSPHLVSPHHLTLMGPRPRPSAACSHTATRSAASGRHRTTGASRRRSSRRARTSRARLCTLRTIVQYVAPPLVLKLWLDIPPPPSPRAAQWQERDGYFTRLCAEVERLHRDNGGRPVVLLGHSMGCKIIHYFTHWVLPAARFLLPPPPPPLPLPPAPQAEARPACLSKSGAHGGRLPAAFTQVLLHPPASAPTAGDGGSWLARFVHGLLPVGPASSSLSPSSSSTSSPHLTPTSTSPPPHLPSYLISQNHHASSGRRALPRRPQVLPRGVHARGTAPDPRHSETMRRMQSVIRCTKRPGGGPRGDGRRRARATGAVGRHDGAGHVPERGGDADAQPRPRRRLLPAPRGPPAPLGLLRPRLHQAGARESGGGGAD
jgi:hypothetical protein